MIDRIYLNRDWVFNKKDKVCIPHTVCEIPYNYCNEEDYQMVSTYERDLYIDSKYKDNHLFLTFEGVAHKAKVFVNEKLVITNMCGYNTFKVDIKDYVKYDTDNKLLVEVDSNESLNIPPFGNVVDYLTYGGIYRDCYLDICNEKYIKDIFVKPRCEDNKWSVDLEVELSNISKYKIDILFNDEVVISKEYNPSSVKDNINIEFDNPKVWDIECPNLYKLKGYIESDIYEVEFGLRIAKFKNDGFYLNNKKVKILGLNRHQSYPYVGYAMPKSMQELDAKILKEELCVNAVRTSHYMQSKYFISMCDRIGLLVFTEAPGWQHLGDSEWKRQHIENVKNMILEYRNHPSIILWGVRINESIDDSELYKECNKVAHILDSTRQTGGVRCYKKGEELEDVYTYNDFCDPNMERGLSLKSDICSNDIPYLVSEFNGHMHPTKIFDREDIRVNQVERLAKGMDTFYSDNNITGFFAWCMFDYNTHKDFGSGDRICYHGVLDMFRNPKVASFLYSSQGKNDYFELSSHLNMGDYDASMVGNVYAFTNADKINLYRNGELIKEYTKDDSIYKNIPNRPILINDFVGNLLEVKEGYTKKEAEMMKTVLSATLKYGDSMPLKYKLLYLRLMLFHHVTYEKGYELYGKYIGNWGSKEIVYTFEAIRNNKVFKTINLSKVNKLDLEYNVSSNILYDDNTYDVSLVRLKAIDQNGNVLPYYNEPYSIECSENIEIIGPKLISFKGGYSGIYVKSKGIKGKATLSINTAIKNVNISFEIK